MTKRVRVENADVGTNFRVIVQVWDKGAEGEPDVMHREIPLNNPCDITDSDIYITNTRYLVVKEA